jgi:Cleft lip and palate transmembrane protein 1 (CLPTM1)
VFNIIFRLAPDGCYLPLMQYNYLSSRISDLIEVKNDMMETNVTLSYGPISVGKLRLGFSGFSNKFCDVSINSTSNLQTYASTRERIEVT